MKPGLFFMIFSLDDDREISYGFTLADGVGDDLAAMFEDEDRLQEFDDVRDKFEEYGVHDATGGPNPKVEAIGFISYEVSEDKILELMGKWRDYFVSVYGEQAVGPVTDISAVAAGTFNEDDWDIYTYCLRKNT